MPCLTFPKSLVPQNLRFASQCSRRGTESLRSHEQFDHHHILATQKKRTEIGTTERWGVSSTVLRNQAHNEFVEKGQIEPCIPFLKNVFPTSGSLLDPAALPRLHCIIVHSLPFHTQFECITPCSFRNIAICNKNLRLRKTHLYWLLPLVVCTSRVGLVSVILQQRLYLLLWRLRGIPATQLLHEYCLSASPAMSHPADIPQIYMASATNLRSMVPGAADGRWRSEFFFYFSHSFYIIMTHIYVFSLFFLFF